jgi:chromosome segregation ATPase
MRKMHEALVEAEIRLLEATSELESLREENEDINRTLRELEKDIAKRDGEIQTFKNQQLRVRAEAQRILDSATPEELQLMEEFSQYPTLEDLNNEIEAVGNRLELMAEGNPQAVHAYKNREREIARKNEIRDTIIENLETTRTEITTIREQWEPQLDALISTISDGFSHNFAQIGCAGQVDVHKDEDFEKWSVQIQVRFR